MSQISPQAQKDAQGTAIALRDLEQIAEAQASSAPAALYRLRRLAERREAPTTGLFLGGSSRVAAPFALAAIEAGLFNGGVVMVTHDSASSANQYRGRAMEEFARSRGVPVIHLEESAVLKTPAGWEPPHRIFQALETLAGPQGKVAVIESIGAGSPTQFPGLDAEPYWTTNLTERGTLQRIRIDVGTESAVDRTLSNMGTNPNEWWRLLHGKGRLDDNSFFASFGWEGRFRPYGTLSFATTVLRGKMKERFAEFRGAFGPDVVIAHPAQVSEFFGLVPGGLLVALDSLRERALLGDTTTFAVLGALELLAVLDRGFNPPQLGRQGIEGRHLRFDLAERAAFHHTMRIVDFLDRLSGIPKFPDELPPDESEEILVQVLGWERGKWQKDLKLLQSLSSLAPPKPPVARIPDVRGPIFGEKGESEVPARGPEPKESPWSSFKMRVTAAKFYKWLVNTKGLNTARSARFAEILLDLAVKGEEAGKVRQEDGGENFFEQVSRVVIELYAAVTYLRLTDQKGEFGFTREEVLAFAAELLALAQERLPGDKSADNLQRSAIIGGIAERVREEQTEGEKRGEDFEKKGKRGK